MDTWDTCGAPTIRGAGVPGVKRHLATPFNFKWGGGGGGSCHADTLLLSDGGDLSNLVV